MPPEEWRQRIRDILEAIEDIRQYTAVVSYGDFAADRKTAQAVAFNLAVIGEAATRIPSEVHARAPQIPWAKMRAMRNVLIHQYWQIDPAILWDTSQHDLPPLVPLLRALL